MVPDFLCGSQKLSCNEPHAGREPQFLPRVRGRLGARAAVAVCRKIHRKDTYYMASNLSAVLGPQLAGVVVDLTGENYRNVFLYGAVFMALAGFCMTRVRVR